MNLNQLREKDFIIFEGIVGSTLYGLNTPTSDVDTKGIFKLPIPELLKMNYPKQISDERNDTTFYEVIRYLDLLKSSNPNILELLYIPDDKIISIKPEFELIRKHRDSFITTNIRNSLGGYAIAQIKKARGQNKKIVNPVDKLRKGLLDFCYILTPLGSTPIVEWFSRQRTPSERLQKNYGVSSVNNAHNTFYIYYNKGKYNFRGIAKEESNELRMSSIPKETIANYSIMYFNSEGYSTYCKDYREYWDWVEKRNEARYNDNAQHGKGYDGKNLMHCFRLLEMGIDAARTGTFEVVRPNKDWLLKVRRGEFEYEDLIKLAEDKIVEFDDVIKTSPLSTKVDGKLIDNILEEIRNYEI